MGLRKVTVFLTVGRANRSVVKGSMVKKGRKTGQIMNVDNDGTITVAWESRAMPTSVSVEPEYAVVYGD